MSKQKQQRRAAAGPMMDPAAISYQMSPIPGAPPGPGNMNGNPENVTSLGAQLPSMQGGMQENLYRDGGPLQYPQMGSEILNPMNVRRSMVQQNTPVTPVGNNGGVPYGMQMQPPADSADPMESMRLAQEAQMRGGIPSDMGMIGTGPVMGSMPPEMTEQTMNTLPLMGMAPPVDGGMIPGSTPQKTGKKRGNK